MTRYRNRSVGDQGGYQPRARMKRPVGFYKALGAGIRENGLPAVLFSENSLTGMACLWRKWVRFCGIESYGDPHAALRAQQFDVYSVFFTWLIDNFPRIRKKSTAANYWKDLSALYKLLTRQPMSETVGRSMNTYLRCSIYPLLEDSEREKQSVSVDDFVRALYWYWAEDESVLADERQRVQIHLVLLLAAYTGQRPCSLLDSTSPSGSRNAEGLVEEFTATQRGEQSKVQRHLEDLQRKSRPFAQNEGSKDMEGFDDEFYDSANANIDKLSYDEDGEEVHAILYKHIRLRYVRLSQGTPCCLVMELRIQHTKGEERKPQPKIFLLTRHRNPLLCPISYLLALALDDEAFEASSMSNVRNILNVNVPVGRRKTIELKWRPEMLNVAVFRRPEKNRMSTSASLPLPTYIVYAAVTKIFRHMGFKQNVSLYFIRRAVAQALDKHTTPAKRDQVMGHSNSRIVQFYLNTVVKCSVQKAFLGEPNNDDDFIEAIGTAGFDADSTAPVNLTEEQKASLRNHPKISEFKRRVETLSREIREAYGVSVHNMLGSGKETSLTREYKAAMANLKSEKMRLSRKWIQVRRERHFQNSDTKELEMQFNGQELSRTDICQELSTLEFQLEERARIVKIFDDAKNVENDQKSEFCEKLICALRDICPRREGRKLRRLDQQIETSPDLLQMKLDPKQCIWCFADMRLIWQNRVQKYSTSAKMCNHVNSKHLSAESLRAMKEASAFPCPHLGCTGEFIAKDFGHLKNHFERVHCIKL